MSIAFEILLAYLSVCKPVLKLLRFRGVAPDENEIAMISGLLFLKNYEYA